ncbi:MAG: PAS domain S-box protein [Bacteroidales bacterium]|nr:PAS domain S-box protein [Bacteroidales bacterium]
MRAQYKTNKESGITLSTSEIRYRRLFETAKDGVLILNVETGMIIDVNPFLIELLGYSKNQFMDKAIWEIGFFKDIIENRGKYLELKQKEYVRYENLPLETADGRKINVEFVSNVYSEGSQKVIQCNIRDISNRVKIEKELHESEAQYRNLADSGFALIWRSGTDKLFNYFNKPWLNFTGRTMEQEIGDGWTQGIHPDDNASYFQTYISAFNKKEAFDMECRLRNANGEYRWIRDLGTPNYDSIGNFLGYIGHCFDITEQKNNEEHLKRAKEKAEESDRLKSAFLANMSHEIRTPMNGILGFAGLLREPELTGEEQKKYIGIIEKSGARMLNIINDIISISKIESGQMEISISETNINEQIEFIYTFFKPEAEQKGIYISCKYIFPADVSIIMTDCEKIYSILTNLVKNAIKFTQKGSIEIGCEKKGDTLEFFVKDTGEGITLEKQKIIFERFMQGSESLTRNYEGAGLGLSISKAYAEMLGGKIWAESEPGNGSTFYFTIPVNNQSDKKSAINNHILSDLEENSIKKLKILIAEDDETSEILITMAVKVLGKEILTVRTGVEAIETCRNNPDIDLILMDIKMPEMDGLTATKQIRQFNKEVIIIAQTAFGLKGDRAMAIKAGCNEYIAKPFNKSSLMILLKNIIKNKKT